jgi:superkiller protein 3
MAREQKRNRRNSADAWSAYQAGLSAFDRERYADAIALLTPIRDADGMIGTLARFYLGQAQLHHGVNELRAGRNAAASRHLALARDMNPHASGLSRFIAACHAGQGRFDRAAAELERAVDAGTGDADQPIRLAHAFARDGKMPRAVETLVRVIDEQPHRVDVRIQLGLLYGAAEEFEDAICVFQEAVELAPLDAGVRQHLGLALAAAGDHREAIEHLSIAQKLRPHDAYMALLLTMALDAAGTTCVKLAIAPAARAHGKADDQSLDVLGDLVTENNELVEAFLSLPASDVDAEIFAMLAAVLERALERRPDYADLYHHCSRVYQRLGMSEPAIQKARKAIEVNPGYVQALIQLGRLYAETDDSDSAIDRLEDAVRCGGDYPDVHCLLGELYRREGNTTQARESFRRALEINADYARAREAMETVLDA